jgi:hypothetical protein
MLKVSTKAQKFFLALIFLISGYQLSSLFLAAPFFNWELDLLNAGTVSQIWARNISVYERLVAILKEHNYSFSPWPANTVAGDVVVYGDIRPVAQLAVQLAGRPVYVFTKKFELSPQSLGIPAGGTVIVFSTSAAWLGALLWAAALVAASWCATSKRLLRLRTSLVIALVPPLLFISEVGYVAATGGPAWLALLLTASALAPPASLLLGAALARAGERRRLG